MGRAPAAGHMINANPTPERARALPSMISSTVSALCMKRLTDAAPPSKTAAAATPIGSRLRSQIRVRLGRKPAAMATSANVPVFFQKRSAGPSGKGVQVSDSAARPTRNKPARTGDDSSRPRSDWVFSRVTGETAAPASSKAAPIGNRI